MRGEGSEFDCGAANPGCSRLSGGALDIASARPLPAFRRRNQPCLHWIALNILPNPLKLSVGSHQMVVALILPERLATTPQHSICFMRDKSLQGPKPLRRLDVRCGERDSAWLQRSAIDSDGTAAPHRASMRRQGRRFPAYADTRVPTQICRGFDRLPQMLFRWLAGREEICGLRVGCRSVER
jgi:hypothetical protein